MIAIGNGHDVELLISGMISRWNIFSYAVVNESGALVYAKSEVADEEFPNMDHRFRSAISLGC